MSPRRADPAQDADAVTVLVRVPSGAHTDRIPAVRLLDTGREDNSGIGAMRAPPNPKEMTMNAHTTLGETTARSLVAGGSTSAFATAMVAALLAATVAGASAAPTRSGQETGPGPGDSGQLVDVACFNTTHQWNVALDGPIPRCSRTVR